MTDIIKVDPKEIDIMKEEGGKLVFKKNAEEHLLRLLMLEDMIEKAIDYAKEKIADAGLEIDPGFKGVKGEHVSATYRNYGAKYDHDWKKRGDLKAFLKKKEYWSVDSEAVETYLDQTGELPEGIFEKDRSKKLSISTKDE